MSTPTTTITGITIADLDARIPRRKGTSARTGHIACLVARGARHDYDSEIVSAHRTLKGAKAACRDGCRVWIWDSYCTSRGGYRLI